MIYFSEKPLVSWQPNLIMLDLEDDLGHIYVTRNTYDQAVLLSDRFNHENELVEAKLGCLKNQEDVVSYMVAVLPTPINILSTFYHLIDSSVKMDVENTKQLIGVLSYMSMNLDFNMMLKIPFEFRANLVFTKSILLEYQNHFEDFNFKISSDSRHILREVDESNRIPRSKQKDFILEEKEEEEEVFDVDSFIADLGWDDIKVPKLTIEPEPAKELKNVAKLVQQEEHKQEQAMTEEEMYDQIASRYA